MSNPESKLTRAELHNMLWTRPFVRLAKELGYSYLELVTICADFNIPRPSGGYWYRLAHGGAEDPTPLPPAPPGKPTEIPLGPRHGHDDAPPSEPIAEKESVEAEVVQDVPAERKKGAAASDVDRAASETPQFYEPIRISRQELYQKVWKTTLNGLVSELGTTHAELTRVCGELNVPRPDQSYWSRLHLNLAVEVPPLPSPGPGMALEALLRRKGARRRKPETAPEAADATDTVATQAAETPVTAAVEKPAKVDFTRAQLYEAIWSKSCVKLAAELGISDVALAKTCRRMGIPRPRRGYWARIEAGERLKREPLPEAKPNQSGEITFYVAANVARREEWAANNLLTAARAVKCGAVELPPEGSELHSIAERHRQALENAKPGDLGFVAARGKNMFPCTMSATLVPRFVRALHALVCELEDRDYGFKLGSSGDEGLQIIRDDDEVGLTCSEAKLEVEREPTPAEKRRPSWTWQLRETKPAGVLSIEVSASGLKGKRKWIEGEGRSLEEMLGVIVEKVEAVFRGFENQRQREAEWEKQRAEAAKRRAEEEARETERQAKEEKERKERERLKRHETKLEEIAGKRRGNLATAASEWIAAQEVAAFLKVCEQRWRRTGGGKLSKAQSEWLAWAKIETTKMEPFETGYPDPALDGSFAAGAVPVGGPYPKSRDWPRKKSEEAERVKTTREEPTQRPQQYPWGQPGWKY